MEKQRKLVTIQRIKKLEPIEGADSIEVATILGWKVVVKKGEFMVGHLVIYFEVDSFLPLLPQFEFLSRNGVKKMVVDGKKLEGYRLKTIRLKGQVSQGLALPLDAFADKLKVQQVWQEGNDVTESLGVVKYEPPIPANLQGLVKGFLPSFVPRTDELRIQSEPWILEKYADIPFVVTEKLDGTSFTAYIKDGVFGICSRNLELLPSTDNTLWRVAKELELEDKLRSLNIDIVLQGELVGEGIQKNPLRLSGQNVYFFNMYKPDIKEYFNYNVLHGVIEKLELKVVPNIISEIYYLPKTVEELISRFSNLQSTINQGVLAEGVVIRPVEEVTDEKIGRLSFKVINPDYLLKHDE